jgi:hypothetical protein
MKLHAIKEILVSAMHSVASIAAIAAAAIAVLPGIARADGETQESLLEQESRLEHFDKSIFTEFTAGYGTIGIDQTIEGRKLKVLVDDTETEFVHGFGTHADSSIVFPLDGNCVSFSARVGVDREKGGAGSVTFYVYGIKDGTTNQLWKSSKELTGNDNSETTGDINNIADYDSLKLFAAKGDNYDNDHADWIDPKIVMKAAAAAAVTVNENAVVSDWVHTRFTSATVTKGVFAFAAGASFSGEVEIGKNGAIAVDMTGKVSTEDLNKTIDLFSTPTLALDLGSGDSVEKAVFLAGPVVGYTIDSRTENGTTVVYATITDVSNIASTRKVTVFTAGYDTTVNHWNNEGYWSAGAPAQNSFDIGVFCEDASVNYMAGWVNSHGDFVVRGATVTAIGSNNPNLDMLRFAGNGTVVVQNASVDLRSSCSLTVDAGVTLNVVNGTVAAGTGDSVSFEGALVIGANAKLKVYGYENATVDVDDVLALVPHARFAEDVTSAKVSVVGHDDAIVAIEAGQGDAIVARVTKVVGETVYWVGGESGDWWEGANWDQGIVPLIIQTAVFTNSATVNLSGSVSVGTVDVAEGATVKFRTTDIWNVHPSVQACAVTGAGKIQLFHAGFKSSRTDSEPLVIDVAEVEILDAGGDGNRDSWIEGKGDVKTVINSDLTGSGYFIGRNALTFGGDNSAFTGKAKIEGVGNSNQAERRFTNPAAGFSSASKVEIWGFLLLDFNVGEISFTNLTFRESWGAAIYLLKDAEVTMNVADGSIYNNYQPNVGFQVMERVEGSYARDNATAGCSGFMLRMTGSGTFDNGLSHGYIFEAASGTTSFSFNNTDATYRVKSGAAISGSATIGAVAFESGAKVLQTVAKTADEVEEGDVQTYTYSVPNLTLTGDYDVSGVLFGVTNPDDLPAATLGATPFTMLTATGTLSGAPTTDAIYKPEGSAAGIKWVAAKSDNSVVLKAAASGFIVVVY